MEHSTKPYDSVIVFFPPDKSRALIWVAQVDDANRLCDIATEYWSEDCSHTPEVLMLDANQLVKCASY